MAGLYTNKQLKDSGIDTNRFESANGVANTSNEKKLYSLCKPSSSEGDEDKVLLYHTCSTVKGGSGGPILIVSSLDKKPKVIGIHIGASGNNSLSGANEAVLITPQLLKKMIR